MRSEELPTESPNSRDETPIRPEGVGDFRGDYGYGRPAHRQDPNASYGFENPPPKPLSGLTN